MTAKFHGRVGFATRALLAIAGALSSVHAQSYVPIPAPCPVAGGGFGGAVEVLDFNGDGVLDFAVGSSGQDAVFVYYGPTFAVWQAIVPTGILAPGVCPTGGAGRGFGASLASRAIDAVAGDELAIGAPDAISGAGAAHIVGIGLGVVTLTSAVGQPNAKLGTSVALGDFDLDGLVDLAAGAPATSVSGSCSGMSAEGRVHVFRHSFTTEVLIDNPRAGQPGACNGWFGVDMVVGDSDADGTDDLFVSSEANPIGTHPNAGAIYRYGGVVIGAGGAVTTPLEIVDPNPLTCDPGPRFSKSIDVRGSLLIAGAPRKDRLGSCSPIDIGGTFAFAGPSFSGVQLAPGVLTSLLGYRVVLADLIGDPTSDVIGVSLGTFELFIWDGAALSSPPVVIAGPPGGAAHWVTGVAAAQLVAGGKEEIVLGDPDYNGGIGRAVVLR